MTPIAAPNAGADALPSFLTRVGKSLLLPRVKLADFIRSSWPLIEPGTAFIPNWHIDLISEYLMAVHLGQIHLLDINMPPRFGKSSIVSVCFPCWEWTEDPTMRYLFSSYAQKQCNRDSLRRREIIESPWYRNRWGELVRLAKDQNLKTEFKNSAQGHMITAPVGGSATGAGGKRLVTDDLINPKQAHSAILREASIAFLRGTLSTRLDTDDSSHINVQQRLHKDDVSGIYCLEAEGYTKLVIPIQAKIAKTYIFPISKREKVFEKGELLCKDRRSVAGIAKLTRDLTEDGAQAQLYQEPPEEEGLLFKRETWVPLKECPPALFVLNAWDTAVKEKKQNDPSAGLCLVKHAKGYHFCKGVLNERLRFSALKIAVKDKYQVDKPDAVLIEDKSSGQQLIQEMQDNSNLPVVTPDSDFQKLDKYARACLVQPLWAAGKISYDPDMPGAAEMIEQFAAFPQSAHDDMVDAGVHGVRFLQQMDREAPPSESGDVEEHAIDHDL